MADEKELIAEKLKRFRKRNHINQYDFADECGISRNLLSLIETGKDNLTLDTLNLIATRLGITSSDLLNPSEVLYFVFPSKVIIEGIDHDTYGIGAIINYVLEEFVLDLSTDFDKVKKLVQLFNNEALSIIHLRDIVEDFIIT